MVIDERECGVAIHDGSVWIKPWVTKDSWTSSDPWWKRGISFSVNPFEWRHMSHEVRRADGSWVPFVGSWEEGPARVVNDKGATFGGGKEPDGRETFTFPYRYVLKNGTVQDRTAEVFVERRSWRPRCLRWTSLFEKSRTSIDVKFDDEVGERTGSWKGGTVGCGYNLLPDESPEQCLRRMERERKF
jgi:hypothetical protein